MHVDSVLVVSTLHVAYCTLRTLSFTSADPFAEAKKDKFFPSQTVVTLPESDLCKGGKACVGNSVRCVALKLAVHFGGSLLTTPTGITPNKVLLNSL